jgi:transcriptional regulator with XRE-family HTH domain
MEIDPQKLKTERDRAALRHVDLAAAADLSERRMQQFEEGTAPKRINANVLRAIAKRLGVKEKELQP